ncbi:hypothetical protein D3C85_1549640 [compost metagenome]
MPINKRKSNDETSYQWSSFVTWNPFQNYDADYHVELIKEIKSYLPENTIKYTIELDKRGFNHVHFISDAEVSKTKIMVEKVIFKYLSWFEVSYHVAEIKNKFNVDEYLQKAPVRNGLLQ